tara:strand:+ start:2284 stop:2820 length:537 start_codon:yes stop_codon:yes gene_type:complete
MAFWQTTDVEPKRGYRFILSIPGFPQYIIKSVSKPSFTIGKSQHQYLNHTFYYPGRTTWNPINFTIVDTVGDEDNGTAKLMALLDASGYNLPAVNSFQTISKKSAVNALQSVQIQTINAEGDVIESWRLKNAWIESAQFGQLSYDSEDLLNVEIGLSYDNAGLSTVNPPRNYPTGFSG